MADSDPPPARPPAPRPARRWRFKAWARDIVCGFLAYAGARLIWGPPEGAFKNLPRELFTFAILWAVLQLLVRGWAYARISRGG